MFNKNVILCISCLFLAGQVFAVDWENFKGEDYEEPAGASFQLLANPQDNIYGIALATLFIANRITKKKESNHPSESTR